MPSTSTPTPRKVLLVDDHPIVHLGLKALLEDCSDFVLAGFATSNQEAISLVEDLRPDLVVLDLQLPGRIGLEAIPQINRIYSNVHIIVYSSLDENMYAARSIEAGAWGYVHKEAGLPCLLEGFYAVSEGKIFISESVQQDMLRRQMPNGNTSNDLSLLSNQELNVLRLIGKGLRLSDIASKLGISPKTVGTHRERIKNKLTLHSGKELDRLAMSHFS